MSALRTGATGFTVEKNDKPRANHHPRSQLAVMTLTANLAELLHRRLPIGARVTRPFDAVCEAHRIVVCGV
jgi:hypothetical protein